MKKIIGVVTVALLLAAANNVSAQGKIGHINAQEMVVMMPEYARIDTALRKFQADSLNSTLTGLVQEYQYKDSLLNKTDTSKMPAAIKAQYRQDIENLAYQVQNWQQIAGNILENKQGQLLQPVYLKVRNAIQAVAKEKGYAYVLASEALIVSPPSDDILPLVAAKLGVKVPANRNTQR